MKTGSRIPRRANKVPTAFFAAWGLLCAAALLVGPWLLHAGIDYRRTHQEVPANVSIEDHRARGAIGPIVHLAYTVDGRPYELTLPPPMSSHERAKYLEGYRPGSQVPVWYLLEKPSYAEVEGDRGTLPGGIIFTAVGVAFVLIGILAFIAEFYPNRFVRFG